MPRTLSSRSGSPRGRRGAAVALTGAGSALGEVLLAKLLADPRVSSVLVIDRRAPTPVNNKLRFQAIDLTSPSANRTLAEALIQHQVDALAHLPCLTSANDPAYAHEVEAVGTMRVLAGAGQAPLPRLVVVSTTTVYGASPSNPNHLSESRPLGGAKGSRFLTDRVEIEHQVVAFRAAHPTRTATVLRFAPIVGAGAFDPIGAFLGRRFAPRLLGYDPLVQVTHIADAVTALTESLLADHPGEFNIASEGVLPLSDALRRADVHALPLPILGGASLLRLTNALGVTQTPPALLDFLRYLCVADVRKAQAAGLLGTNSIQTALEDVAMGRSGSATANDLAEASAV